MLRLFEQHAIRPQTELEGMWDFQPLAEGEDWPSDYAYSMPVPGCWEQHPDFLTYRGRAVYRKKIKVRQAGRLRIEFKGVSHTAEVFFDGQPIGKHYNAYTAFSVLVPDVAEGAHELAVRVDNRFTEDSALHVPNDYYTYGGIVRPVAMETIGEAYIERIRFMPSLNNGEWTAEVGVLLRNVSNQTKTVQVRATLGGEYPIDFGETAVPAGEAAWVGGSFAFSGAAAWSSESPRLYELEARLYEPGSPEPFDDLIERVGFREVRLENRKLLVNGNPVFLKGFNRHEDFGVVGCALPLALMAKDVDLMLDMGANAVRTSHYPNDERFLDLCDEKGLYVWEENHARGLGIDRMKHPLFEKQCEDCNREMIEQHGCHPSIVIWGLLNECDSDNAEGRPMYEKQFAQIRGMDGSRPVTSATCKHFTDICLDLGDIISFNLYPQWYEDVDPEEPYLKELKWAEESGGAGKPVIVSEFGAAALYGFREPTRVKWSEERQADIIDRCLEVYMSRPEVVGTFIWQFADCRVTEGSGWLLSRARTRNNKGVVDDFRRPKMAVEAVKKHYRNNSPL
ncbi:beta-glucuronidase [Cohnella sp. CFH 77786]|uniref:glycoside hydrolase family 2 protein n=1 Tax=Cohnella sp. CFH 77786 TaxID=2662265 RepID=UPI001C60B226|nr:glycoside hydrolase family 2 TIM barrel-domain containing protein [Cohnella sp. CFH 77786]MBW5447032.1 beta-glucuronidase [Cohnella sp. CFH 77786]